MFSCSPCAFCCEKYVVVVVVVVVVVQVLWCHDPAFIQLQDDVAQLWVVEGAFCVKDYCNDDELIFLACFCIL